MKATQNTSQKWNILFGFAGDCFNIFFSVFCALFQSNSFSFEDITKNLLLLSNFVSFSGFFLVFIIELKREFWLVDHFDYSKRYSSVHLLSYKQNYPQIFDRLSELNWKYFCLYRLCKWVYFLNFIFTLIWFFGFYSYNFKTIIGLFSSFWFCYSKIYRGLKIAEDSLENTLGFSYYNTQSLPFNRIDQKFKRHNSTSNPPSNSVSLHDSLNGGFFLDELQETRL